MKIQTFSIVAGTKACNARCPFCVSKMTGMEELPGLGPINKQNLHKAIQLAKMGGCTTVLITGKGEPTLYPEQIDKYLDDVGYKFPFIELQTNGLLMGWLAEGKDSRRLSIGWLNRWKAKGLNTIALSVSGIYHNQNARIYHKDYPHLPTLIKFLHEHGFSVRLCLMMGEFGVRTDVGLSEVIDFCREYGVEQLTARSIAVPHNTMSKEVFDFAFDNALRINYMESIKKFIKLHGTLLMKLEHGAEVYDVNGQNVALSDCLTPPKDENIRQLIFYGDGRLTYDWQHKGAILLGGR